MTISTRVRWIRFNLVGVMGFALQTVTLWLLVRWAGVNAGVAITLAVLAAVSHNFAWHETVTWPNLPAERQPPGEQSAVDWMAAYLRLVEDNASTLDGRAIDLEQNRRLGQLLGNLRAVESGLAG